MSAGADLNALIRNDVLSIVRDRFLWGSGVSVTILLSAMGWFMPAIAQRTLSRWDIELEPYYGLIASLVIIQSGPFLMGVLFGFVFLEAREEKTLKALLVSPVTLNTYLGYRVAAPIAVSVMIFVGGVHVLGFGVPPWYALIPIALVGSLIAAIVTFFIAAFADNKVQGFAIMKIVSATAIIPLGAYFIDSRWQYFAGLFPPFWVFKAYWTAVQGESGWWMQLGIGAVSMGGLLWLLVRRIRIEAYR